MYYFWGLDTYAAREAIEIIAKKEKARIRWVDREQLEEKSISDIVAGARGLFGVDFIVVRDPSSFPKSAQEALAEYIEGEGKNRVWIVWDRGVPDKRSKLWRSAKSHGREFLPLSERELVSWLVTRAEQLGGVVQQPAAYMLVARLGNDRWRLEHEVQRLLLIAGAAVDVELVERETAATEAAEIFATLDALVRGDADRALTSIETLVSMGHSEFYVLSMLTYQFRTLLVIRAGLDEGKPVSVIAREGKLHPYVVEKNMSVAQQLSVAAWRDILTRILASDFAIKQGRVDSRTGLLMLVITLSKSLQVTKVSL